MLRHLKPGMLLLSIAYLALGLLLLVMPATALPWICTAIGAVLILTGGLSLWRYLRDKQRSLTALFPMVGGVITLALGLTALMRPDLVERGLPLVFGLFLVIDGILRAQSASQLRRRKGQNWHIVLLLAPLSVLGGGWLCWLPFADPALQPIVLCGILLVAEGALNLGCTVYTAMELHTLDRVDSAADTAALAAVGEVADETEADDDTTVPEPIAPPPTESEPASTTP